MKLFFIAFFVFTSLFSFANDIDDLLDIYAQENDLSYKTKKINAGNVLIYTRSDLDRMKIESLSEILRSIPYTRYDENNLGYPDLFAYTGITSSNSDLRVYINEREITSPLFGNGLAIISKLDLRYIDHIEVYYNVSSFEFGIEPSGVVIRLYTKNPTRENGSTVKASLSSYGSSELNASFGKIFKDFSVFAYANKKEANQKKIYHDDTPLSRDRKSNHLFLSLGNKNHHFSYNRIDAKADLFASGVAGSGDGSPLKSNTDLSYNVMGWYSSWLEQKLSIALDYIYITSNSFQKNDFPFGFDTNGRPIYSMEQEDKQRQFSATIKYRHNVNNHNLLYGLNFRKKYFNIDSITTNESNRYNSDFLGKYFNGYNKEKLYGIFLEDTYEINNNNKIVVSSKLDKVIPNGMLNKQNTQFYRLGYLYHNNDFIFRTFLTSTKSRLEPYYIKLVLENENLHYQKDQNIFFEFEWDKPNNNNKFSFYLKRQKNNLHRVSSLNPLRKGYYYSKGLSFSNRYNINDLDYISSNIFLINYENKISNQKDTAYGGFVKIYNNIGKFNLFNELVFKNNFRGVKSGYNYNTAVTYNVTKDLALYIKGQNIFNSAIKSNYTFLSLFPQPARIKTLGPVEVSPRKFTIGLEYKFWKKSFLF